MERRPENGESSSSASQLSVSRGEGLRLQLENLSYHERRGQQVGGWKVGMTSGPNRDRMGVGFRPFGYILQSRAFRSGASLGHQQIRSPAVEPELAFQLGYPANGRDIEPASIARVITAVAPAFEVVESRISPRSAHGLQIADNLNQWGIVIGRPTIWNEACRASKVRVDLWEDGKSALSVGPGFSIDEPLDSISIMCRILNSYGRRLEPGQWIITGAFARVPVKAPGVWTATFSEIGSVTVTFV